MKRPDFFIVGAPRCGTTAMYHYLKAHPDIFMSVPKEIFYFGSDLTFSPGLTLDKYLSYFATAANEKRVGEASVTYLASKRGAAEIKEFDPLARIIIMLRNPVDYLYSVHSHLLSLGDEDIVDFEAALEAEQARREGLNIPSTSRDVRRLYYREMAQFSQQIGRFLDAFGRDQVSVIILDDLENNPSQVYRDTLSFLDVDPGFQTEFEVLNANMRMRHQFLSRFSMQRQRLALINSGRDTLRFKIWRRLIRPLVLWDREFAPRPPMDPDLRARLRAEFVPEVEKLSELLGRDLTHWSREPSRQFSAPL